MFSPSWRRALAALALFAAATAAHAQQQSPTAPPAGAPSGAMLALVVDLHFVVNESKAGKSVRDQFDKQRQAFGKEVSQAENSLRAQQQEIERQRTILSAEAFSAKAREFEQKVADLRRGWEQKRETLQYSLDIARDQIQTNIIEIVKQLALERRANFVLQKQQIVLVDKAYDITEETMGRLDEKLPTVAFNLVQPPNRNAAPKAPAAGQGQVPAPKPKPAASQPKSDPPKKQ